LASRARKKAPIQPPGEPFSVRTNSLLLRTNGDTYVGLQYFDKRAIIRGTIAGQMDGYMFWRLVLSRRICLPCQVQLPWLTAQWRQRLPFKA